MIKISHLSNDEQKRLMPLLRDFLFKNTVEYFELKYYLNVSNAPSIKIVRRRE